MNTQLNQLQRLLAEIDSLMGSAEVTGLIRDARSCAINARSVTAKAIKIVAELDAQQPSPAQELERPDFGAWWATYPLEDLVDYNSPSDRMHAELVWKACSAQHDCIVGALRAEVEDADGLSKRLGDLLREIDLTIRGPEPGLTRHGYPDLPQRVKTLVEERNAAQARGAELEQALAEKDPFGAKLNRISEKLERCDALLAAQVAQAGQVPDGWRIEQTGERIVVQQLTSGAGYAASRAGESGIAESVLFLLAADLIAAAPAQGGE